LRIGEAFFDGNGVVCGLVQCRRCGLEFVNPRPAAAVLDAFYNQPGYAAHSESDDPFQVAAVQARLKRLQPLAAASRVLDIGCGNGLLLEACRMAGCECVGVEPSQYGRRITAARGLPVFPDLGSVPAEKPFDLVTLYHVMEHVADPDGLLAAVKTRLGSGGRLCLEVPNLRSVRAVLFFLLPRRWRREDDRYRAFPIHLYGFTPGSLEVLLRRNGFTQLVITTTGVGFGSDPASAATGLPRSGAGGAASGVSAGAVPQTPSHVQGVAGWRRFAKKVWRLAEQAGWGENLTAIATLQP